MRKRGALSIEMIIIMILALGVLFLAGFFLFREGGVFSKEIAACESRAGTCIMPDSSGNYACDGRLIMARCKEGGCCLSFTGDKNA